MFLQFMHRQSILHEHGSFSLKFSLKYLQKTFVINYFMFSCSMTSNLRCSFKAFVILQALRKKSDSDFCGRNCLLLFFHNRISCLSFFLNTYEFFHCRSVFQLEFCAVAVECVVHDKVTEEGYVEKPIDLCMLELDSISMLLLSFVHFQLI